MNLSIPDHTFYLFYLLLESFVLLMQFFKLNSESFSFYSPVFFYSWLIVLFSFIIIPLMLSFWASIEFLFFTLFEGYPRFEFDIFIFNLVQSYFQLPNFIVQCFFIVDNIFWSDFRLLQVRSGSFRFKNVLHSFMRKLLFD